MADTRNRFLLAKLEGSGTYGTSSAPAGSDALLCSDLEIEPLKLDKEERKILRGFHGNFAEIVIKKMVTVKFKVEVAGSGTRGTAPRWGRIHQVCGFSEAVVANTSVTYSPVALSSASGAVSSATLDFRNDGLKHLVTGARGTVSQEMKVDAIPQFSYELTALYNAPSDTSLPTIVFANQADPRPICADDTPTVSVFGYAAQLSAFNLDIGNEIDYRQLAGGTKGVRIPERKPKGSFTIEAPSIAGKDYFSPAIAQALGAIQVVHGTTAGNIVTTNVGFAALDEPSYEDMDGIQMLQAGFRPLPSVGNDEITYTLT
jgi:hypothetical protein